MASMLTPMLNWRLKRSRQQKPEVAASTLLKNKRFTRGDWQIRKLTICKPRSTLQLLRPRPAPRTGIKWSQWQMIHSFRWISTTSLWLILKRWPFGSMLNSGLTWSINSLGSFRAHLSASWLATWSSVEATWRSSGPKQWRSTKSTLRPAMHQICTFLRLDSRHLTCSEPLIQWSIIATWAPLTIPFLSPCMWVR